MQTKSSDSANGDSVEGSGNLRHFLRDSVAELKKVHSPTRAETIQATLVTLFIMFFIAIVLFVLDMVFQGLMHSLLA